MKQALLFAAVFATAAHAHVSIENPTAAAGSNTKVVLQVTHGCSGSAIRAVTVHVPAGFLFAKPRVKPGWTVSYERVKLDRPLDLHGRTVKETTSLIRWEGGIVPNDAFDEFVLMGKVAEEVKEPLAFRVVQSCDKGEIDWQGGPDSATPAPLLEVTPSRHGGHHH